MSQDLFIEPTLDEAISSAIEFARNEAVEDGEPKCIYVCVNETGICPRRGVDGGGCDFCDKITVDKFGKVSREVMQ